MTKPDKNFDTGLRILEVLRILLNNDVTKGELIEKMNNNPLFDNVYTFEAFIKYFNTLSVMGFKIDKDKNKYKLKNAFKKITLTDKEEEAIIELISYIKKLHNKSLEEKIKKVIYKSIKYFNEEYQIRIKNKLMQLNQNINVDNLTDTLENLLYDKQILSLTYIKNNNIQETITVKLKEIIEKKNNIILVCNDIKQGRNKKINAASVISIMQTPNITTDNNFNNDTVIFRLYGRLSQVYKLKKDETVLDFASEYKTISNKGEDRDILLRRLLKYGENCKIVHPKSMQEEFIALTNNILKNLEEKVTI